MAREYNVSDTAGACCRCGKPLEVGEEFVATLQESGEEFRREDYCLACWPKPEGAGEDLVGQWRARRPKPEEKKKIFVDDEVLVSFFERLEGTEDPARIAFRFVLTLVLMRKKLLAYEGSQKAPDGAETWTVRRRGTQQTYRVLDPHLDEEKIVQVSRQLGEILEADL